MIAIRYDANKVNMDELVEAAKIVKEMTGEEVLVLPKDFSIMWDITLDDLLSFRQIIDKYIDKLQIEKEQF